MREIINSDLQQLTADNFITAYIAWERVRQLLAKYYIPIPSVHFDNYISDDVTIPLKPLKPSLLNPEQEFLYFAYAPTNGKYCEVHAEIITQEEVNIR